MGFGDNSTHFQRGGTMTGGIRVETGCYTSCDATFGIPTQFVRVFSLLVQNGDSSSQVASIPAVSGGFITATPHNDPSSTVINYIACGF